MTAETDKFIVATFALWAGDFAFFERLLNEFSPPRSSPSLEGGVESPEAIIRAIGALRLRQLWQKRSEFEKLATENSVQDFRIVEQPLTMETQHLRATVWRTGERGFSLQAYLKDVGWQEELFGRARREASKYDKTRVASAAPGSEPPPRDAPGRGLGAAWTVVGNPFLQVELTDLGLIDVSALWIKPRLPENAEQVKRPLLKLLQVLDEPVSR